ncbi:MAG TPA: hypothetical protein RMH99_22710, partial [Sandaracinaceae bacterium LLY-WYZ-13_1]|nr:hypothetical protein [Sandaracinaceae bacterium LLY-WYZ-13_1]
MVEAAAKEAPGRGGGPRPPAGGPRFALRFEDGRGRLALSQPFRFALGTIDALELDLGPLRFPLDLSAGPRRFRTRRTRVRACRMRVDVPALVAAAVEEPHALRPLAPARHGLAWALRDAFGTVAFETRAKAEGPDLWVGIAEARAAAEGPAPPLVRVHVAARAIGLDVDEERGVLRAPRLISTLLAEALVPHGWRVPDDRASRLGIEVLGPRRVAVRTLDAGEAEGAVDDPIWERARRLAPVTRALGAGDADEARRRWRALRERS